MSVRDFTLPDLGEGLEEGDVVAWHVEVGDIVELNQTVAEIETAKAVVEVPSPFAGRVVDRIGEVGQTLEVGSVFLRVDTDIASGDGAAGGGPPSAADDPGAEDLEVIVDAGPAHELDEQRPSTGLDAADEPQPLVGYGQRAGGTRRRRRGGGGAAPAAPARVLAKPPVRKLAKDLGVDLADLAPGSGPDGIITRDDVRRAADAPAPVGTAAVPPRGEERGVSSVSETSREGPGGRTSAARPSDQIRGFRGRVPGEVEQIAGIRKRIIEKMEQSRRGIPHASCTREADLTELWRLRHDLTTQAADEGYQVRITPLALICRATVLALRRFPTLNARIDRAAEDAGAGEIRLLEHINLGVAVDSDRGLMVPNIKDAHARSTLQLAAETADLAAACRDGKATPAQLTGGTFTVNNYGAFGNDDGDPIINAPEVGILGIGAIRERPWVVEGQIVVRRVATFRLAFDHRVCDGGEAGRFVTHVADLCEQPTRLLLHV